MGIRKWLCAVFNHDWGVVYIETIVHKEDLLYKIKLECTRCGREGEIYIPQQNLKRCMKLDNENCRVPDQNIFER